MKKVSILLLAIIIFSSCQQRLTRPLKGNYPSDYTGTSDKPADEIWSRLIEYCAKNGINIKLMDRKSGLIVSEWCKIKTYTFENKDGIPEKSSADVILGCETVGSFISDCQEPHIIWTRVNFKLKEENNKTSITIRLGDLVAWYSEYGYLKEIKSTGFLEKQIIEKMK